MVGASTIVERTHKTSNLKWRQGSLISQNPLNSFMGSMSIIIPDTI